MESSGRTPPLSSQKFPVQYGYNNLAKRISFALAVELLDISTQNDNFNISKAELSCQPQTLVILFGFYGAPLKVIKNYSNMYHSYGYDVLYVKSSLKHFSWPKNSKVLVKSLLQYIKSNCQSYGDIVVHAFSMGAYNFTVLMGEMYDQPTAYGDIQSRIRAVVYDSLTVGTLKDMAVGVGMGASENFIVRKTIPALMNLYFWLTHSHTVTFYDYYISLFKQKPLNVPTLVFSCKNDPISDYQVVEKMVDSWGRTFNFPITHRCWETSRHAAHYQVHKEEYTQYVDRFLFTVPGLTHHMKVKSKI
ncbi:uncharacterized protein LOC128226928 [Mya arenaria]|uniref:uncharacterized protein LOC128226928 n=1 Tax=Mya arenaria TaxID=6604 RepID=UPI0022DF0D79|nr:uncharacterized protein LOC128226928 [Mya arenaria]